MATFYLDYVNGLDANDGSSWALAWKTFTLGATAARIAPGDIIRVAKSPAPASLGTTGVWTNGPVPATKAMGSSTNATPIVVTITTHGYSNGDIIQITAHTTNTNANGTWVIANVAANTFELVGSVGNGTGGASGTAQKINAKAVVLAAAQTAGIDYCEVVWTGAGDTTTALVAVSTDAKEGEYCVRLTLDASPQTSILQAYSATGTLDLSAYQTISFRIKNSAALLATHWTVRLCSDTAGVTTVDTFIIPAIPSTAKWVPLTIARNGGGNLGNAIASIAIYTDSVAPTASSNILVDNFIACTTAGLNLQSLISKNSAEQGGAEGWYAIQSIRGTTVLLDTQTNSKSTQGRGYSGTTETVTTYKRETTKTALVAGSSDTVQEVMDSGTLAGGNIQFQCGYNTTTTVQEGETFFDGLSGNGNGIFLSSKNYITFNYLNACRYDSGLFYNSGNNNTITNLGNVSNNTNSGILYSGAILNSIVTLGNANNNGNYGVNCSSAFSLKITTLSNANNNGNYGVLFSSSFGCILNTVSNANNNGIGVYSSGGLNTIKSLSTSGNASLGIGIQGGELYLYNALISETSEANPLVNYDSRVFSHKHDQTADNHYIFTDGGTMFSQVATRHTGSGVAWELTVSSSTRVLAYPLYLSIAKVAVTANNLVTVKAWMKKDHATNVGAKLVCRGGQLTGVSSDVVATKADDTSWEELTITFTPTEAGVIEIEAWAYYVAGNSNVYVDDMTITQA